MITAIFMIIIVLIAASFAIWWIGQMPATPGPLASPWIKWLLYGVVIIIAIVVILNVAGVHLP